MDFIVERDGQSWQIRRGDIGWRCAIGRAGARRDKREGDGATPVGVWPLRRVLFRPDRADAPETVLPVAPLGPEDGWCDDPAHPDYNRPVKLPHPARHERMWRNDRLYDLVVVLGHNDAPVVPHAGSAVFLHVAADDYAPTEGCVALAVEDLRQLLRQAEPDSRLRVED